MPETDHAIAIASVKAASGELDEAKRRVADAYERTNRLTEGAAADGQASFAAGTQVVSQELEAATARLDAVGRHLDAAATAETSPPRVGPVRYDPLQRIRDGEERTPVASIDEVAEGLQAAADKVDEAVAATTAAESDAEEIAGQMAALGVQDKAMELSAVHDVIERIRGHLAGCSDDLKEAMARVKAAAG
jgi:hypothetical protein